MAMTFATDVTVSGGQVLQTNKIKLPTSSGGTTYGTGTNGQILKSNGTTVYWADDSNATAITDSQIDSLFEES